MRKGLIAILVVIVSVCFIARLGYLQFFSDYSTFDLNKDMAIERVYDYPQRGLIYDRNGKLLVSNQSAYDVMIIPKQVKVLDTLEFCKLLNITKDDFIRKYQKAKRYSPLKPSIFQSQLSRQEYAYFQEKLHKYKGFFVQKHSLREYETQSGANVLGFISEVNENDIKKNPYYRSGENIGRTGVEKQYEPFLRGEKGVRFLQKDKYNRVIGKYKEGIFDTLPVAGQSLQLTIDEALQSYGELLMQNKRGGIVAIEPETGEILALVSAPSYDPSLLIGNQRSKNYTRLYRDSIAKPLFDRALSAEYPPGSPFKVLNGLIGLQEGVITSNTQVVCHGGYHYGSRIMKCHLHSAPYNLTYGIANSCNAYFAYTYTQIINKYPTAYEGIEVWRSHLKSFGLGNYLGSDLTTGRPGKIPSADYYNRVYGKGRWGATFNISNGIGQGEILVTPIQLANVMAAIANRGYYYIPHIVKKVGDSIQPLEKFLERHQTTIQPQFFEPVIRGMNMAYQQGTARFTQIEGIDVAAKTGTAENYIRVNGKRMQLTDHSIFAAFAPIDKPKIAIVVFVENGYFGARIAGPIASLMIEKYLKGEVLRKDFEKNIIEKSLQQEYEKPYSGKPFLINQ